MNVTMKRKNRRETRRKFHIIGLQRAFLCFVLIALANVCVAAPKLCGNVDIVEVLTGLGQNMAR